MKAFREAIEAVLNGNGGDFGAVEALLAEDVVFTSPVAFKPYPACHFMHGDIVDEIGLAGF